MWKQQKNNWEFNQKIIEKKVLKLRGTRNLKTIKTKQ